MKKQIALIFNQMIIGGAEKVMIRFLHAIDHSKYDVTLFTLNQSSAFLDEVPAHVNIIFTQTAAPSTYLKDDLKSLRIIKVFKGILLRTRIRLCKDEYNKLLLSQQLYPKLPGHYDCAIAYKINYENMAILVGRTNATKKYAWLHGPPLDQCQINFFAKCLQPVSKVFCVSQYAKNALDNSIAYLTGRTEVFYNILDADGVREKASMPIDEQIMPTAMVTVGRLSPEKGQDMIPRAVRILLDKGHNVHWYLVGDGPLREKIEQEILKYQVSDHVFLLGMKENPYPYIKACDIYVQTSYSEGYCTTTMEAKILLKPIVTTDAPGMREQFISGENGLIVDAMTPEALADGIRVLLEHPDMGAHFIEQLRHDDFDNTHELQKLYAYLED